MGNSRYHYRHERKMALVKENKKPRRGGAWLETGDAVPPGSDRRNVRRLKALWALNYVETNSLSLR